MSGESRRRVIKKIDGGHGHHGGAWKVAYADFVTAMMALFMVLWLLASTDASSRKEISQYFRSGILPDGDMAMKKAAQITPSVIEESAVPPRDKRNDGELLKENGEGGDQQFGETEREIQRGLEELAKVDPELAEVIKNVHVEKTPDGLVIEAVDDDGQSMLFDSSSSKLKEPLERFLQGLAPVLAKIGKPIEINGHTDARPFATGATRSNWDLSYERASAAREIFEAAGVDKGKISGVVGRGASHLYNPSDPYAAENRRLSVLVIDPVAKAANRAEKEKPLVNDPDTREP